MKKLRLILSMVCLLVFGLIVNQADAQQTRGGTPPTFLVKEAQALPAQAYVKMPVNFSISELLKQDAFEKQHNDLALPHYAKIIHTDITMDNSGVWTEFPDGTKVWRVAVEAKGAKALMLYYDDFYLPAGSSLFIYNADKTHVTGAYDNASNPHGSYYSTVFVAGDISVLEYVAPAQETGDKPKITVTKVGYGYNNIKIVPVPFAETPEFLMPDGSLKCQVNVVCSPEGDLWQLQSTSVCNMTLEVGGGYVGGCTGTLINNTKNNGIPYIISAFHCTDGMTAAQLAQSQFHFFFEELNCEDRWNAGQTPGYLPNPSDVANHYTWMKTLVGAEMIVSIPMTGGSDGILMKLLQEIPQTWISNCEIIFAGWDRRNTPATTAQSGVCISHPSGDVKKIATYVSPAYIAGPINWQDYGLSAANAHWAATFVPTVNGFGQTESGSSGSGLLNQNGLLIGTLSGGGAAVCNQDSKTSYFGGLYYHWDQHGNSPATQMKTWLDPDGGGTAETCLPWPNCEVVDLMSYPTTLYALESSTFSALGIAKADSISWEFEGGTPATSTEPSPVVTYNAAGLFDAKLTAHFTDLQGQDSVVIVEKDDYITVTVKGGALAAIPVANLAVLDFPESSIYTDNAITATGSGINDTPPTVLRNGATGSATATYWKEVVVGTISNTQLDGTGGSPNYWVRRNNTVATNDRPVANGFGGSGDYYYAFYYPTSSNLQVRMFNRQQIDLSAVSGVKLKFKLLRNPDSYPGLWHDVDGLLVQYRNTGSGAWTTLLTIPTDDASVISATNPGWKDFEIELPNLSATYQIGFVGMTGYGYGMALDNIEIVSVSSTIKSHVTLWEGDAVNYYDLSTGVPVFYKYDFEGGEPATSTSATSPIPVQYNTEGLYDASQWVKNTLGEDSIKLEDYVTVFHRVLESDTDEINPDCGDALTQDIEITSNRSWSVTNMPAWITATPSTHTHTSAEGTEETTTVTVTVTANTGYQARMGAIVFTSDDGKVRKVVSVNQSTDEVPGLTAVVVPENNAQITWNRLPGMPLPPVPPTNCDISLIGGGDFEDVTVFNSQWSRFTGTGNTSPGWLHVTQSSVSSLLGYDNSLGFALSQSYDNSLGSYNANTYLVTPQLNITASHKVLKYWIKSQDASWLDTYEVLLSTTSAHTTPGDFTVTLKALSAAPGDWTEESIDLSAYVGQDIYIAFHHASSNNYVLCLDDVSGVNISGCTPTTSAPVRTKSQSTGFDANDVNARKEITDPVILEKIAYLTEHSDVVNKLPMFGKQAVNKQITNKNNLVKLQSASNETITQSVDISSLTELTWADWETEQIGGVGAGGDAFKAAAMWPVAEAKAYKDYILQAIGIVVGDEDGSASDITIFVMEGYDNIIYSQHLGLIVGSIDTLVELDYPVVISGNADLLIGYSVASGYGGYPGLTDYSETPEDGKGNVLYYGSWRTLTGAGIARGNWLISGYAEKPKPSGFTVYRERRFNGTVTEPAEIIATGLVDTTYFDEDIRPGGEYCYWVTYTNLNLESCPSDTACIFIKYSQNILNNSPINKEYGDGPLFKIDSLGTDGSYIRSSADTVDYFISTGRTMPVKLELLSGTSITLTGSESDYTATIERTGTTVLRATVESIADTLLPDTVLININVRKHDLYVIAEDKTKQQGTANPTFTLLYDDFAYTESPSNLDGNKIAISTSADILSPIGEYKIAVTIDYVDANYNLIPVDGVLRVVRNEEKINVFTPYDIDNLNDYFMPGYKLKIFNRYGVLVYETENVSQKVLGWDGTFKGSRKLVNPGVYYYVAYDETTGKVIRKGSVNVVKK